MEKAGGPIEQTARHLREGQCWQSARSSAVLAIREGHVLPGETAQHKGARLRGDAPLRHRAGGSCCCWGSSSTMTWGGVASSIRLTTLIPRCTLDSSAHVYALKTCSQMSTATLLRKVPMGNDPAVQQGVVWGANCCVLLVCGHQDE